MKFIRAIRPLHWVKNLLVLAPLFFSGNLLEPRLILRELAAFACFCLISGHVYIINDLVDAESDRLHPDRKDRMFASGAISRSHAIIFSFSIAAVSIMCGLLISYNFALCAICYAALTHLYTFALKRNVVAGIAAISTGMLIRILSGAVAIEVPVSVWVYPCSFALTFYVVAGKRISDAGSANGAANFIRALMKGAGALTVVLYAAYTFSGVGPEKYDTDYLWLTIPFVAASCWRYYVITIARVGGEHLRSTLSDRPLITIIFAWAFVFGMLIYF